MLKKKEMELEEKKAPEFDRMFGVMKARLFFLFSYDNTGGLLGLVPENLNNFPSY